MHDASKQEIKMFYCYAREDINFRDKLQTQLSSLNHRYRLTHWSDREIVAGENWEQAINKNLDSADVILLLISPYFIASEYCYGKEMQRALERHHKGACRIIPILLRPAQWEETPLRGIQLLPTTAKPITRWAKRDEAYHDIVKGIDKTLKNLIHSRKTIEEWLKDAQTSMRLKRYEEAVAAYDQAIHLDPNNTSTYNNKGIALIQLKRYEEALAAYDQAIRFDPNNSSIYTNKGIALSQLKRYEEALAAYNQAIDLDFDDIAYINKGEVLSQLKRYEEALAVYNQITPVDPHYAFAFIDKGEVLSQLKRYVEALAAYDQAIFLEPGDALAYYKKGTTLHQLGRYEDALSAYEQALRLNPKSIATYEGKGNALLNLNRDQEALDIFEQIIFLDQENVDAYKIKGNLLEKLKRPEEALEAYDKIREILGRPDEFTLDLEDAI